MRKLLIFLIFFFAVTIGVFLGLLYHPPKPLALSTTPTTAPTPELPISFSIPKFNVTTTVEPVGLDSQQRMDVPKGVMDVGWYSYGYRPGQNGNAVLDGHLDTPTGSPAVFWDVSRLQAGDVLTVKDTAGKVYIFSVTHITSYSYDQLPLQEIFAASNKSHLNLITCAGTWDRVAKNYSQRTVVYSTLQETK